jgi:hypothetical protein
LSRDEVTLQIHRSVLGNARRRTGHNETHQQEANRRGKQAVTTERVE